MKKVVNAIILLSYLLIALYLIFILNEYLTIKELTIIVLFLVVIEILFIYLLKKDILLFFSYPCILFVLICLFTFNIKSDSIISFATDINNKTNYILVTLKEKTLSNQTKIGYVKFLKEFNNQDLDYEPICYSNSNDMIKDLNQNKIDAIVISEDQFASLDQSKYIEISELKLREVAIQTVNTNSDTKLIYISSSSDLENVSINIILGINTKTKQIIMIGIPKDYYVTFKNSKEVLTNINKFGLNESIKVVENIIENKFDYYINVDLKSMGKLITRLDYLDITSDYTFISAGYEFKEGKNKLTNESLIPFVRYSNSLMGGSRIQNSNQLAFLESLINKLLSDNKYLDVLTELKDSITTNIPKDKMVKFIKKQITYNYKWDIIKYSMDGTDTFQYTYLSKCCKLSVMEPNIATVNNAITMIEYLKSNSVFN